MVGFAFDVNGTRIIDRNEVFYRKNLGASGSGTVRKTKNYSRMYKKGHTHTNEDHDTRCEKRHTRYPVSHIVFECVVNSKLRQELRA
jgi:hypothetical protein